MKNWLRNKLTGFLFPEENNSQYTDVAVPRIGLANRSKGSISSAKVRPRAQSFAGSDADFDTIHFNLYNATGGKILETRTYDERNDCWNSSLYVIESNENFGESIGKIVFSEMLKKG
jgi:hypothetical protein